MLMLCLAQWIKYSKVKMMR